MWYWQMKSIAVGGGQILTLKNDPMRSLNPHEVSNINFVWVGWRSIFNIENDTIYEV